MNEMVRDNSAPFLGFRKNIDIFISHSHKDAATAKKYESLFQQRGLANAWTYENRLNVGADLNDSIRQRIEKCEFFILIVSEDARGSRWVPRELGLALKVREANDGLRPVILPIKRRSGAGLGARIQSAIRKYLSKSPPPNDFRPFVYKDYDTGQEAPAPFPLDRLRVFDEDVPHADDIEFLIDHMTPKLLAVGKHIHDPKELYDTGAIQLYETMFPEEERIPTNSLIRVAFDTHVGVQHQVVLTDHENADQPKVEYEYVRKTNLMILTLGGTAIGFALFNYNKNLKLFFGSYIGVHNSWRSHGIANELITALKREIDREEGYAGYRGFIFEVEPFKASEVRDIIERLERTRDKRLTADEESVIRRFLRIAIYDGYDARLFVDETHTPLEYVQPCMDLDKHPSEWEASGAPLSLMFVAPPGDRDHSRTAKLWEDAVNYVVVEHIGKTYAQRNPNRGAAYLKYATKVRDDVLAQSKDKKISLIAPLNRQADLYSLASRWWKLGIKIKI
jgi:hypothetical protein